jgi:hypothetical protein
LAQVLGQHPGVDAVRRERRNREEQNTIEHDTHLSQHRRSGNPKDYLERTSLTLSRPPAPRRWGDAAGRVESWHQVRLSASHPG